MRQVSISVVVVASVVASGCGDNHQPADAAIERCASDPCRNDGACTDTASGVSCACSPGFVGDRCEVAAWSIPAPTRDVDLLFVVDNSGSMQTEQQRLVDAFGDLLAAITDGDGVLPNVHVGVVSSNVGGAGQAGVPGCPAQGDDGTLQATVTNTPTHCASLTDAFASDVATAGGRDTNYTGSLADTFACLATRGTYGCGFEMHLESAWRALQPDKNPGFYRPGAHLAVIIVADEDDCSTRDGAMFGDPTATLDSTLGPRTSFRCHEFGVVCDDDPTPRAFGERSGCRPIEDPIYEFPVAKYVDFFGQLKAPRRLTLSGFLGTYDGSHLTVAQDPSPGAPVGWPAVKRSCGFDENDPDAGASPPVRLAAFLGAFGARARHASACDASFADTMRQIGSDVASSMASVICIEPQLADDDPAAGLQPRCTVALTASTGQTPIPRCTTGQSPPCWNIGSDARSCPDTANALWVTIDAAFAPAVDATLDVRCETP